MLTPLLNGVNLAVVQKTKLGECLMPDIDSNPFHLAFPVADLKETRDFYCNIIGCQEGRSTDLWIDFNLYGNSISAYLHPQEATRHIPDNHVDRDQTPLTIPVRHFGVILEWDEWESLVERLRNKGIEFTIGPRVRFVGKIGEQGTIYFNDPCGNVLEFKAFKNRDQMFQPFTEIKDFEAVVMQQ
jgi:extradiol dioxygenase family protein